MRLPLPGLVLGVPVAASALLLLAGACREGPRIEEGPPARSQDSRVRFVVLHYTAQDFETSLRKLTEENVSAHYLVSDGRDGRPVRILRLVDESRRAWHAGNGEWLGHRPLNASSIGIEIVNRGFVDGPAGRRWEPYPEEQVEAVVALLRDVTRRHGIPPERVIAHSDLQPSRKLDPGPLFPWKRLADERLALWPDEENVERNRQRLAGAVPPVAWFQERLGLHGYGDTVPKHGSLDDATCDVIAAFQMKYRPALHDGVPDEETAAILAALAP